MGNPSRQGSGETVSRTSCRLKGVIAYRDIGLITGCRGREHVWTQEKLITDLLGGLQACD